MHRLLCFITLLSSLLLSGCGGVKIPFIGSDDDDVVRESSSGISQEAITLDKFGPAQGSANETAGLDTSAGLPVNTSTAAVNAEPVAPFDPARLPVNNAARAPAPAPARQAPRQQAPQPAAPATSIQRIKPDVNTATTRAAPAPAPAPAPAEQAETQVARVDTPAPAAQSARPENVTCDAFTQICPQLVEDFVFRYRAGVVEGEVYGVVGYVFPNKEELKGKEVELEILFALFEGEQKANMPVSVTGVLNEPLRFEKHFTGRKPDLVYVESYRGRLVE